MKSVFTLAAAVLLSVCANAQPVINASNVASNFDADLYFALMPASFSPGPAGPNQTWDYSSIGDGTLLGTQTAIPYATSPLASQFPEANYCYTMDSAFSDELMYFYHSLTPTSFEIYSLGYLGEVGEDFRQDPRTYVTFPYTYNTVFTDTYQRATDSGPQTVTATYDAYGTLIMPFGTFQNVVRQKVVTEGNTNYTWFNVNPFYPILQTAIEDGILGFIQDHTQLGIGGQGKKTQITIYPNPVTDQLTMKLPVDVAGDIQVLVTDISGKHIVKKAFSTVDIVLETGHMQSGIYFVSVTDSEGATLVSKFVKA
ncbi:MAG TPA: T9SS type A sorting domain-containing protein [Flavobacterium sp.]|jgi:hypothetical protein